MGKPQRLPESISTRIHVYQNPRLLESTSTRIHVYQNPRLLESTPTRIHVYHNLLFSTNAIIRLIESYRRPSKTACVYTYASTTKTPDYLFTSFSIYSFSLLYITSYSQQELYTLRSRQNLYYSFESSLKPLRALTLSITLVAVESCLNIYTSLQQQYRRRKLIALSLDR